ncbi:MAG TPA: metal-dependent hydrolase [Anaerolineales bacterium]
MPQAGLHGMAGIAARKWMPKKEWLLLGVLLGNMFPDLDNLVVAYATLAKLPDPEQYHRTFTHSVFTFLVIVTLFYLVAVFTKNETWKNFGVGFGAGILMHMLLDLVLWFNGVPLFWPLGGELNFWEWFTVPPWLKIILDTGEFLMFGWLFIIYDSLSRQHNTDEQQQSTLRAWAYAQFGVFVLFTALFFFMPELPLLYTIFGALYLVSLIAAVVITIQIRATVEMI